MTAPEMISLYNNLYYVSMVVAVIGLVLAVFFYFYFDIHTIHALMTGKAKEDTIRRMAEQNAKTGNLRNQFLHTGPTGRTGRTSHTHKTESLTETIAAPVDHEAYSNPVIDAGLQGTPEGCETSILQSEAAQTVVLQSADPSAEETAVLNQVPTGIGFSITESTLVVHTNEII